MDTYRLLNRPEQISKTAVIKAFFLKTPCGVIMSVLLITLLFCSVVAIPIYFVMKDYVISMILAFCLESSLVILSGILYLIHAGCTEAIYTARQEQSRNLL
jgi:uncharacterized membrane protein